MEKGRAGGLGVISDETCMLCVDTSKRIAASMEESGFELAVDPVGAPDTGAA